MAEGGGIQKRAMRTVLGFDEDGVSTSESYNIVVKDHGVKSGLQYDSVCITPVADTEAEDMPEKTVQVLYTQDAKMQGNLKFATVAVWEAPKAITDERTVSKMVHLRNGKLTSAMNSSNSGFSSEEPGGVFASDPEALKYIRLDSSELVAGNTDEPEEGIFASDPEALKFMRFGPKSAVTGASNAEEPEEGIFASDPEALKFIRFGPKPAVTCASNAEEPEEGIFASDPEALKFIRFGPKPSVTGALNAEEPEEGIFASDLEALKFMRFGPKPAVTGASNAKEPEEGIFASDPEALKFIRFGPKPSVTGASSKQEPEGIFASDPEALECVRLAPRASPNSSHEETSTVCKGNDEGELLAEATGVQLKDNRAFSVRVSGHELPDGQRKKFVSVRGTDGGPTRQEIDSMQVSVETVVGEDGLVEKFISVE